jgi:serine/threonine protein kinase
MRCELVKSRIVFAREAVLEPVPSPQVIRFDIFEVDLRARELRRHGKSTGLPEQSIKILAMLLERPGEVVLREEIRQKLWPNDTVVEFDHGINAAIKRLRHALNDSAESPRFIETLARRGYRWIAPVESHNINMGLAQNLTRAGPRPQAEQPDNILIGKKVSHYRVLKILGGGGMGVVYEAEDLKLARRVALKFLPEELGTDPTAVERFEREARAVSSVDHPNICPIHEFGEHDGRPFFAMPLLQGETLRERLACGSPLTIDVVLEIAIQIASGLDAAHQQHMIHRDIKPANIFVTTRGQVRILDFGLAKVLDQRTDRGGECENHQRPPLPPNGFTPDLHLTRTGVALGTAAYMSPEQVRGEALDARTDIFSFGLVLYEMATVKRAFAGETAAVLHAAILNESPESVRELNPDIPSSVERIISKSLQKDRNCRYQSVATMSAELKIQLEALHRKEDLHHPNLWPWALTIFAAVTFTAGLVVWTRSFNSREAPEIRQRQLTNNSSENPVSGGSISPDGRYLAYADLRGLHTKSITTGETHDVPQPESLKGLQVNWGIATNWVSDGGSFIANANVAGRPSSIWAVAATGETPRKLREDAYAWAVSRDGSWLAFTTNPGQAYYREMWRMRPDGQQASRLYLGDDDNGFFGADWSPDGRRLSYLGAHKSSDRLETNIETRDLIGGPAILAKIGRPEDWTWSPDGRLIYISSETGAFSGNCNFWAVRVNAKTGKPKDDPKRLTDWAGFCMQDPSITADGKQLSFRKLSAQSAVYVVELRANGTRITTPRRLTLSEGEDYPAAWTRDNRAVVFQSYRDSQWKILRQSLEDDATATIATGAEDVGGPSATLTPNGEWVLYIAASKSPSSADPDQLMRAPIAGGPPEPVLASHLYGKPACARAPSTVCVMAERSPDHNQLVFSAFDPVNGRPREIRRYDTDSATGTRYMWDLSPDGTRIALLRYSSSTIHILPLKDLADQRIPVEGWPGLLSVIWASDGKSVFSSSETQKGSVLLRVNLNGSAAVLWEHTGSISPWNRPFPGGAWSLWAIPSADGHHLAIHVSNMSANMWMMENF